MNRTIADSSAANDAAARLNGTCIEIDVERVTRVRAAVHGGRLMLLSAADAGIETAPADAVIAGSLLSLVRSALDSAAPHAGAAVSITGDAQLAAGYRALFKLAAPDPEEQLSRVLGDGPARALSTLAANSLAFLRRVKRTAGENVAEYLQEESRDLVSRTEADEFVRGVDAVREAADRVAARLELLEQRLQGRG